MDLAGGFFRCLFHGAMAAVVEDDEPRLVQVGGGAADGGQRNNPVVLPRYDENGLPQRIASGQDACHLYIHGLAEAVVGIAKTFNKELIAIDFAVSEARQVRLVIGALQQRLVSARGRQIKAQKGVHQVTCRRKAHQQRHRCDGGGRADEGQPANRCGVQLRKPERNDGAKGVANQINLAEAETIDGFAYEGCLAVELIGGGIVRPLGVAEAVEIDDIDTVVPGQSGSEQTETVSGGTESMNEYERRTARAEPLDMDALTRRGSHEIDGSRRDNRCVRKERLTGGKHRSESDRESARKMIDRDRMQRGRGYKAFCRGLIALNLMSPSHRGPFARDTSAMPRHFPERGCQCRLTGEFLHCMGIDLNRGDFSTQEFVADLDAEIFGYHGNG